MQSAAQVPDGGTHSPYTPLKHGFEIIFCLSRCSSCSLSIAENFLEKSIMYQKPHLLKADRLPKHCAIYCLSSFTKKKSYSSRGKRSEKYLPRVTMSPYPKGKVRVADSESGGGAEAHNPPYFPQIKLFLM